MLVGLDPAGVRIQLDDWMVARPGRFISVIVLAGRTTERPLACGHVTGILGSHDLV